MKNFEFTELGKLGKSTSIQEMKNGDDLYFRITKLYKTEDGEWKPTNKGVSIPITECANLQIMLEKFMNAHEIKAEKVDLASDINSLGE
jgi:bacterioferritin (cytochrome b1)